MSILFPLLAGRLRYSQSREVGSQASKSIILAVKTDTTGPFPGRKSVYLGGSRTDSKFSPEETNNFTGDASMRKLILLTICFACSATLSLAQAPQDDQKMSSLAVTHFIVPASTL